MRRHDHATAASAGRGVGDPADQLAVVLGCTSCQRTWTPDLTTPPHAALTCCPTCGGWTWLVELLEPSDSPAAGPTTSIEEDPR